MKAKKALETLQASEEFKQWHKEHPNAFLSHVFCMLDDNKEDWQVGYHNRDDDMVTAFELKEKVNICEPEKPFKRDDYEVQELDIDNVKITLEKAVETAKGIQEEHYKGDLPFKTIIILQNIEEGQIYNITYVTLTFKTLNIKIDAATGEVKNHELVALIQTPK